MHETKYIVQKCDFTKVWTDFLSEYESIDALLKDTWRGQKDFTNQKLEFRIIQRETTTEVVEKTF